MHSAKSRHQYPEWTILNDINCYIQGEVNGFQVLLSSSTYYDGILLLQFSNGEADKICLASVSSGNAVKQGEMPCLDNSRKGVVAWIHNAIQLWLLAFFRLDASVVRIQSMDMNK